MLPVGLSINSVNNQLIIKKGLKMEYHCGICIKENNWIANSYNSIVVVAADSYDNKLSFFIKIFNKEENINNNVKEIKFGSAVFFTSEKESIIDLYDIDCLFNQGYNTFKAEGLCLNYNTYYGKLEIWIEDQKKFRFFLFKKIISDAEKELMNSLYKGRLYESHLNTIPQITAENLQNIIQEEKKEIEDYDIADLVKELKISFYADKFYEKTDKPESYNLNELYTFKSTKYEKNKFDTYLIEILNLGRHIIGEYDGWFYAREEAKKDVENRTNNIPFIKSNILRNYSKSEHLNYRVRSRLSKLIFPLYKLLTISGEPIELKKDNFNSVTDGFIFRHSSSTKDVLLSDIHWQNKSLKEFNYNTLKRMMYKSFDQNNMLKEWCIPFPVNLNSKG